MDKVIPEFPGVLPWAVIALSLFVASAVVAAQRQDLLHGWRRYLPAILGSTGFAALAVAFSRYTVDDTFISLRYARNLGEGFGLVFSTDGSPPVEGYTNFLWVLLEVPLTFLPSEAATLIGVKALGLCAGLGALVLVFLLARELGQSVQDSSLALLLLGSCAYFAFWSVGGLETPLYVGLVLGSLLALLRELRCARRHLGSGALFALSAMARPEGVSLALLMLTVGIWLEQRGTKRISEIARESATGLVAFGAIFGPYFIWRYRFYGYALPNTFYARTDSPALEWLFPRMGQLLPLLTVLLPCLFVGIVFLVSGLLKRRGWKAVCLGGALVAASSLAAKSEWMPGFRYELPALPFLCLVTSAGLGVIFSEPKWAQRVGSRVVAILILVASLLSPARSLRQSVRYTDDLEAAHVRLGLWLKRYAPRDASYASFDLGAVPYYSRLPRIVEIFPEGILSTAIAHGTYDVDSMLSDFVVLSPDEGGSTGVQSFYRNRAFQSTYDQLFRVMFMPDYELVVFKSRSVEISREAVLAGAQLQSDSFARWNLKP